ncbi:MAG TPA: hypothetical protein VF623_05525, partial [Segetibacter sp.]
IAFYLSYSFGNFSKAGPKFSFLDGVLASAVVSLFVHAIAISFISNEIHFDILLKVLGGEIKGIEQKFSNRVFLQAVKQFAFYNFVILALFIMLGRLTRWIVMHYHLNTAQNELLRLNNRWWYLFNGFENEIEFFDLLLIDAVVDTKDGTMIYSGFLVNYICNGEELDRIYLRDAVRRELKTLDVAGKLSNKAGIPVTIPGETFSIPYKNIINLNCRFLQLTETTTGIAQVTNSSDTDLI